MQSEKLSSLGRLAASIAHEINNPLAGILTYAKLLIRMLESDHVDEPTRATSVKHLKLVQRETERCLMRAMKGTLLRSAVLTTQLNLNYVRIGTNFAAFPPKQEQEDIAAFLDAKTDEVRATQAVLHRQIETLVAYRKSLIHECVTGQRRVTDEDVKRAEAQWPSARNLQN